MSLHKMSVKFKIRSRQWGMSNLFRKSSKISAFLMETGQKNWHKISQHATPMNGVLTIISKTLAIQSVLQRQNSKM